MANGTDIGSLDQVIQLMERENTTALAEMNSAREKLEAKKHDSASSCLAAPVLERQAAVDKRLADNQILIVKSMGGLKNDLIKSYNNGNAKKVFTLGPLTMQGFDVRDIGRTVLLLAMVYMILKQHGLV